MTEAAILGIEYHLPESIVDNEALAAEFPDWTAARIFEKTGVQERHVVGPGECASDLAVEASRKLFDSGVCRASDIDFILLCTQSPDYFLPTTACLIQDRLGIPVTAGALDFNLGCSGFVYGLGLACGMIQSGQASHLLLLTAETYSRFLHPGDRSVRTIFGDAAAATLVGARAGDRQCRGAWAWGTDGRGAGNLMVPTGGLRNSRSPASAGVMTDDSGNTRSADNLYMNGGELFAFTLRAVPDCMARVLAGTEKTLDDVDLFVFHQANQYMLDHLRRKLKVPAEKFLVHMAHCGNTVSSTIPIVLKHAATSGRLQEGMLVMLVGFGVGYSWAATLLTWPCFGIFATAPLNSAAAL